MYTMQQIIKQLEVNFVTNLSYFYIDSDLSANRRQVYETVQFTFVSWPIDLVSRHNKDLEEGSEFYDILLRDSNL